MKAENSDFEKKYLGGYCDALAIGLSKYFSCPVRAIHPVHVKSDGSKLVTDDFLHAFAITANGPIDAKGIRSEEDILRDFNGLLQSLRRPDDMSIEYTIREYGDADEFVSDVGCNPSTAKNALRDAIDHLSLDESIVEMVERESERSESMRPRFF